MQGIVSVAYASMRTTCAGAGQAASFSEGCTLRTHAPGLAKARSRLLASEVANPADRVLDRLLGWVLCVANSDGHHER